jgi:hypothetical protein
MNKHPHCIADGCRLAEHKGYRTCQAGSGECEMSDCCHACGGSGEAEIMVHPSFTSGEDDYYVTGNCPRCNGTGAEPK